MSCKSAVLVIAGIFENVEKKNVGAKFLKLLSGPRVGCCVILKITAFTLEPWYEEDVLGLSRPFLLCSGFKRPDSVLVPLFLKSADGVCCLEFGT